MITREVEVIEDLIVERINLASAFRLEEFLFPEQLAFVRDPANYKTGVCSRRAGKTISCAADLVETALKHSGVVCVYITLARTNAKKLIWPEIEKINRVFKLGGTPDQTELAMKFPNGSVVYCSGAKDKAEIEKFRGLPIKKVYIDESQAFRAYIKDLIEDVLEATLMDYDGTLCLIGTPGPVPVGYFYDCTQSDQWSHHYWTFWNNPHLVRKSGKTHQEMLDRVLKRRGITVDDPSIQREYFGKWVLDTKALVFAYSAEKNHFTTLPKLPITAEAWRYIIGVDIGLKDSDAIAVIAYNPNWPVCYLIHEDVKAKQSVTDLAIKLEVLMKEYNPDQIVMDTGGLGAKIAEEISRRFGIPVRAAEKTRKFEYIELLNDSLRTGRFMAKKDSRFAQDAMLVEWDLDKTTPDKKVVSTRYHSDIHDAGLYAWREALHWLSEPAKDPVGYQTPEWFKQEEEKMEEALAKSIGGGLSDPDDPWASGMMPGFE